ncbi:hydrogenase maturation nickel metallochaperone HypA [Methanosarcina sp. MSH10X1]|uniref:hydrogenase maturation nickel metallochaperone HypA n=1 Tax=Methanosarcina sp. MSH10X1 TaxID=2507075 RepID=UPI000FFC8B4B|nr:hydrogenase maturation nickel metallochaperone HypA [Methanosarcina sp. MSH10X1]RXA20876.1 hydrogenase maturation nickel metallochaperone HypA [Methanosarcina sp. MSH10X1]
MHEFSIACEIFDQVINTAKANRATEVKKVTLQMGRLAHTNPEQLSFCFNTLAEGSIAENADFVVEMVAPSLECECGYEGEIDEKQIRESDTLTSELLAYVAAMDCPICGKQANITGGRELVIKSIEIETEEDQTADSNNK